MKVFSYWEGPKPPWIQLCQESLKVNTTNLEILTPESWDDLWTEQGQIRDKFRKLRPNVKSDYIRSWILANLGGIWIDADCIVFRDLSTIPILPQKVTAYRVGQPRPQLCSALLGAHPNHDICKKYNEIHTRRIMEDTATGIALGPTTLARAAGVRLMGPNDNVLQLIPTNLIHQFHWDGQKWQTRKQGYSHRVPDAAYGCMLTHRMLGPLREWSADDLFRGNTTISALYRRALHHHWGVQKTL